MKIAEASKRVLFVDDEPALCEVFARMMRKRGFEVDLAAGALEAIRKAELSFYPVVVTDLRMPVMDGLSLIKRLQSVHAATSFVLVTGIPDVDLQRDYGADQVITSVVAKPWSEEDMVSVLERAFDLHRIRQSQDLNLLWSGDEGGPAILLLEDNPGDADLVVEYLWEFVSKGLRIERVERLDDALQKIHDETFTLVLADLSLPDARGLDAVTKLHGAAPSVPLVVLSGLVDEALAPQALQYGAQDYLVKGELDRRSLHRALRYAMERKRAEQRLSELARQDQLTGLANRSSFRDRLSHALSRCRRRNERFAVMFLDLDRFKSVNDDLGHEAGDLLLREVGRRLRGTARASDTVARLGGDEFAILVDAPASEEGVARMADRVLDALREPVMLEKEQLVVTSSIGSALCPDAGETIEERLKSADSAMYRAKEHGRNTYAIADPSQVKIGLRRAELVDALRKGLVRREYVLHFQPQVDLKSRQVVALEALLRWNRPGWGLVPPDEFLPALEETGLIVDVGAWVLDEACRKVRAWRDGGGGSVRICVNLSACQFEDARLVETIRAALARERLPPSALEVEITESLLMRDTNRTKATLKELKDIGVRIAIDDFGTGYSSLAYLSRFSVDVLKVDRSFVKNLGSPGSSERQIAAAIISLGHGLGLEVVAEGIETADQLEDLCLSSCDLGQGFYLGVPHARWFPVDAPLVATSGEEIRWAAA